MADGVSAAVAADADRFYRNRENQTVMLELTIVRLMATINVPQTDGEILQLHRALVDDDEFGEYCSNVRSEGRRMRDKVGDLAGLTTWLAINSGVAQVNAVLSTTPTIYYDELDDPTERTIYAVGLLNNLRFVRRSHRLRSELN